MSGQLSMSKFLILGASGTIGSAIRKRLAENEYLGTYSTHHDDNLVKFDLASDNIEDLPLEEFDYAIILSGIINPDKCFSDQKYSHFVNVNRIKHVTKILHSYKIRIAFPSTEAVFDGLSKNYSEISKPNPLLVYAQQKLEVEKFLYKYYPDSSISFRIAKVYGTIPEDGSLIDLWFKQLQETAEIKCADDYISSVIHVDDVARAIVNTMRLNLSGLYHLGGPDALSRFEMCEHLYDKVNREFDSRLPGHPTPCAMSSFKTLEPRPINISMNSQNILKDVGISFRSYSDGVDDFIKLSKGKKYGSQKN
jgi:dTDP-4-dehydrorhamnose reductase